MDEVIPYCPHCLDAAPPPGNTAEIFKSCVCGIPWDDRDPRDTRHALSIEELERKRYGKARRITRQKVKKS